MTMTMPIKFQVSKPFLAENIMTNIEVFESTETLPYAISRISVQVNRSSFLSKSILQKSEILKVWRLQMFCPCKGETEIQTRTMVLFDLLKEYRWDAKAVIVLGALAATYGGLSLPIHLALSDPVAASIATLNQLPTERTKFRPWLNSLSLLVQAMVDVTKCIIEFERFPFKQATLDGNIVGETMSNIYLATYRVVKSALACLQQIPYFKRIQQVNFSTFPYRAISLPASTVI
uniref:Sieve element occlusion N-terminal domain-containing protein n=1 Tax=Noccaea caerulescens TaxID=107243 RepID=A0A1J3E422_NOCCA